MTIKNIPNPSFGFLTPEEFAEIRDMKNDGQKGYKTKALLKRASSRKSRGRGKGGRLVETTGAGRLGPLARLLEGGPAGHD